MFEDMTYEIIMERMLDRIPEEFDKREGSVIYDALAPAAMELENMYIELSYIIDQSFADTAEREYLIRRAAERGLYPKEASCAVLRAETSPAALDIEIGARFSLDELDYAIIEKISDGNYKIQCETAGVVGNQHLGTLIPIEYIEGLESIEMTEVLIPGEDEEDTEVFRERYLDGFSITAFGGNVADYIQKTNAIDGVGSTKVTPVWNGGGTVKLTIIDSDYNPASDTLVETVQEIIDPAGDASGTGLAPIGHVVTVESAAAVVCSIDTSIVFKPGFSWSTLRDSIINTLEGYFLTLRQAWSDDVDTVVRVAQINSKIMSVTGVLDVIGTKINGSEENIELEKYEIPMLGDVANE